MSNAPAAAGTRRRGFAWAAMTLLVWLLVWIWISWPYSLDDALIHLRYADHLLHRHHITYDGVHDSFGTSSLLYVFLLAALRSVWTSPMLPRVVSSVVDVAFFVLLAWVLYRSLRRPEPSWLPVLLAVALLAVLVAPSAVRWTDDGMETSLVFLDALWGVLLLRRLLAAPRAPTLLQAEAFVFGFLTVLLRVELLSLAVCVSAMAVLSLGRRPESAGPRAFAGERLWAAALPALGGAAGAGLIVLTMHALLPDTALAKAFGAGAWRDTLHMAAVTLASSCSFGMGLLVLWLLSLLALLLLDRLHVADLAGNLLFPAILGASAARGQAIQGIRYFGWTMFFPLLWNLLRLADLLPAHRPRLPERLLNASVILLLIALVPAFAWESGTFHRLFAGRGQALDRFRGEPSLARLHGVPGIAEDVGFVGYFTQGDICDPYGLVNGRAAARLNYQQRLEHCMALHPRFAFGSDGFLHKVQSFQNLAGWFVCGAYPFENVRSHDVHFLVMEPAEARQACPNEAEPIAEAIPGLV